MVGTGLNWLRIGPVADFVITVISVRVSEMLEFLDMLTNYKFLN
jgi:hypothetical protein